MWDSNNGAAEDLSILECSAASLCKQLQTEFLDPEYRESGTIYPTAQPIIPG
jgi:hypothetical protein